MSIFPVLKPVWAGALNVKRSVRSKRGSKVSRTI
jgi:hypothetical protein